jgi:hypothetical protein
MGWQPARSHKDLTVEAGAPFAFFDVRAYVHYAAQSQHVVYLGLTDQGLLDNQVHELYADNSNNWQSTEGTKVTSTSFGGTTAGGITTI